MGGTFAFRTHLAGVKCLFNDLLGRRRFFFLEKKASLSLITMGAHRILHPETAVTIYLTNNDE